MVLDASLLNTQHYKIRIKGKEEQSRETRSALPLHLRTEAIEKGVFGLLLYFDPAKNATQDDAPEGSDTF